MTDSPAQHPRVLIAAFQGWSDAGDATTDVLEHLGKLIDAAVLHVIGAEGYVDFQVHRPKLVLDEEGKRTLDWPDTRLFGPIERPGEPDEDPLVERVRRLDGSRVSNLYLLAGVEPARGWQNFADEIVELVDVWGIDSVIMLGSMYSDVPHSRPIATSLSSENADIRAETGALRSDYEGPAGISTVIDLALSEAGVPPISLWAQVPHYVHSTPSPKATLALLDKLEELLDIVIPRGELLTQANEWEANIDRIAETDDEMSRYIRRLEESRDDALAAETTGDAIALEFEKFLERGHGPDSSDDANIAANDDQRGPGEGQEDIDPSVVSDPSVSTNSSGDAGITGDTSSSDRSDSSDGTDSSDSSDSSDSTDSPNSSDSPDNSDSPDSTEPSENTESSENPDEH